MVFNALERRGRKKRERDGFRDLTRVVVRDVIRIFDVNV